MKKLLLATLLLQSVIFQSLGQTINWAAPVTVASGSMYGNIYPRIALMTNNNPLVSWGNDLDKVYSSRWNGSMFATPVSLCPVGVTPFIDSWAGAEIASSGDTAFVTYSTISADDGKVYTVRTTDGGMTFQDTVRVDPINSDIPRFPSVTIGLSGNPIVTYMRLDDSFGNAEYAVARSMNGGNSYMSPIVPSLGAVGTVCDCCPPGITSDGNRQVLMYRNNVSNIRNMWASFSTDGSASYNVSSEIDQTDWMLMSCPSSGPSGVIIGDSLVSTWMSDGEVFFSTVNMNNQQFGIHRQLFPAGVNTENFPVIAGSGDTLGIVWQGSNNSAYDVFFTWSVTGPTGLGVNIDTLTLGSGGNQTRPDLEYADGKFHLVYSDDNGDNVKYLSGTIEEFVDLQENNVPGLTLTAVPTDGMIDVKINSNVQTEASIQLINSLGQRVSESKLTIQNGVTTASLSGTIGKGIYYVVLITKAGEALTQKVMVTQ